MSAGQCKANPPTGIAGLIFSGWIADADAGLASGVTVEGGALRNLVGAQIEAIARAVGDTSGGLTNGHTYGATVTWASGVGAGKYQFGGATPNAVMQSIAGCDEGGTFTMATGAGTGAGDVLTLFFAAPFPSPPAVTLMEGSSGAANLKFLNRFHVTSTISGMTIQTHTALTNASGLTWHWTAKGYL